MTEMDQHGNIVTGREAINLKIDYIAKIESGQVPYSSYGLPTKYFSLESPKIKSYIEGRFAANGIKATCTLTSQGRLTVYDTDVAIYEGDL